MAVQAKPASVPPKQPARAANRALCTALAIKQVPRTKSQARDVAAVRTFHLFLPRDVCSYELGARPAGECTCDRATTENAGLTGETCQCGSRAKGKLSALVSGFPFFGGFCPFFFGLVLAISLADALICWFYLVWRRVHLRESSWWGFWPPEWDRLYHRCLAVVAVSRDPEMSWANTWAFICYDLSKHSPYGDEH